MTVCPYKLISINHIHDRFGVVIEHVLQYLKIKRRQRICLHSVVNNMPADGMVTLESRPSAVMILTQSTAVKPCTFKHHRTRPLEPCAFHDPSTCGLERIEARPSAVTTLTKNT